jgi:hypothetical protein
MPRKEPTSTQQIRSQLDHPVIDADGHYLEYQPALSSYLQEEGLDPDNFLSGPIATGVGTWGFVGLSEEERLRQRATRTAWWAMPAANTLDVATATFPSLLAERLDEIGIDFAVMYGSAALLYPMISDD